MRVQIIITNWDEKGDTVTKLGTKQTGYKGVVKDVLPSKTVLTFEFDSAENAAAADEAISKFAKGLGYMLG